MSFSADVLSAEPPKICTSVPMLRPASSTMLPDSSRNVISNMSGKCRWVSTTTRCTSGSTVGDNGMPAAPVLIVARTVAFAVPSAPAIVPGAPRHAETDADHYVDRPVEQLGRIGQEQLAPGAHASRVVDAVDVGDRTPVRAARRTLPVEIIWRFSPSLTTCTCRPGSPPEVGLVGIDERRLGSSCSEMVTSARSGLPVGSNRLYSIWHDVSVQSYMNASAGGPHMNVSCGSFVARLIAPPDIADNAIPARRDSSPPPGFIQSSNWSQRYFVSLPCNTMPGMSILDCALPRKMLPVLPVPAPDVLAFGRCCRLAGARHLDLGRVEVECHLPGRQFAHQKSRMPRVPPRESLRARARASRSRAFDDVVSRFGPFHDAGCTLRNDHECTGLPRVEQGDLGGAAVEVVDLRGEPLLHLRRVARRHRAVERDLGDIRRSQAASA